jgi:hypothetical protein
LCLPCLLVLFSSQRLRERRALGERLFGFGDGGRQSEQCVDLRHPEQLEDALVDAGDDELSSIPLAGDVIVNDRAMPAESMYGTEERSSTSDCGGSARKAV